MENSKKVYRRIQPICDSDSDDSSLSTSSDESRSASFHSVQNVQSSSENSEIYLNDSSKNDDLSSKCNSQIIQGTPDNSSKCNSQIIQGTPDNSFEDKGSDTADETENDGKRENLVNFVPSTPNIKEVISCSKNENSETCASSEINNIPNSYLSESLELFSGCDISPIKPQAQKDLYDLKNKNEEDLFSFTSTQNEVKESSEDDSRNTSIALFDDSKVLLEKQQSSDSNCSAINISDSNLQNSQIGSSKVNVKHKAIVKKTCEGDCHSTNNSVITLNNSEESLGKDRCSDDNGNQTVKSAFNLQDLQASLSKIKIKHKDRVGTSSKDDISNEDVMFVKEERSPKLEDPGVLKSKIAILEKEIFNAKLALKTANIALLRDGGDSLQKFVNNKEIDLKKLKEELYESEKCNIATNIPKMTYKQSLHAQFGAEAQSTKPQVGESGSHIRGLKLDALEQLHNSIKTRPHENVFSDEPKGLKKSVELMPHQKHALAWLMWREKQIPPGGILADDMGLGKTLTMISLILKTKEESDGEESEEKRENDHSEGNSNLWLSNHRSKFGGTLVICPASLLNQWEAEVAAKCKSDVLKVKVHHGAKRDETGRGLSRFDMVITTYSIVRSECSKRGALFQLNWNRIILDEAHVVRNYKNQTSVAVCELKSKYRWALTGTPIHNKEVDLFAIIKFLKCSPFDEYLSWRRWVDNKNASGLHRLNTIVNTLMLRRTKEQLQTLGTLQCLPDKQFHQINLKLQKDEFAVYKTVLHFSRTLVAQYLHQQMEKEEQFSGNHYQSVTRNTKNPQNNPFLGSSDLALLNKQINAVQDVKTFQILVLILRLRQICCHPGLIKSMINKESNEADGIDYSNDVEDELESKLNDLSLDDNREDADVEEKVLVKSNPVFNTQRISSKMKILFSMLTETVLNTSDKAVVISQWTEMLNILHTHLHNMGINCAILSGSVPVKDRMDIVKDFNNSSSSTQILLLSLTAGGVGLNLVGANHLFLFDLHWNPQLEAQAYDRVYRVGQTKPVHIYKFLCEETIEQRIQRLQEHKLAIASNVLTGVKQNLSQKLSLNDIKMLFSM